MKNVSEIMFRWCLTYDAVYIIANFREVVNLKTDINPKGGQNSINRFRIYESKPLIFSDFSEYFHWSHMTNKVKYKLHYG